MTTPSSVSGPITRAEILSRAQFWVDRRVTYTVTGPWAADPQGKGYRRDCSGLVSMAWHLASSRSTATFNGWSGVFVLPSLDDLKPGDALLRPGHIELFARWVNPQRHSDGAYVYSFNSEGQTVQNPDADNNHGNRGRNSWNDLKTYRPIRYKNLIEGPTTADGPAFLREPDGAISLVVGGAPFHLTPDEYAALGTPAFASVPAGTFDKMPSIIANGTLVRTSDGPIYIVAGSAKYHLSPAEYAAMGNPRFVNVPMRLVAGLDASPADDTFLRDPTTGAIYQIVGDAKYHLAPAEYAGLGSPAFTNVPSGFIAAVRGSVPMGSLFLREPTTGAIYQVVNGAKYHLSPEEYAALGTPAFTNVPKGLLDLLGTVPANQTHLRSAVDDAIYLIAGGTKRQLSPEDLAALTDDANTYTDVPKEFLDTFPTV